MDIKLQEMLSEVLEDDARNQDNSTDYLRQNQESTMGKVPFGGCKKVTIHLTWISRVYLNVKNDSMGGKLSLFSKINSMY